MAETENPAGWIVFDAVEIDLAGRRLFVAGKNMPLEPKAFAVLALLSRHPGRAFGRDEILDEVWGHRHVTPSVLNRVVTLLRQALGERVEDPHYLHTLHGIGYRFDAETCLLDARPVVSGGSPATATGEPPVSPAATIPARHAVEIPPLSAPPATEGGISDTPAPSNRPASSSPVTLPARAPRRVLIRTAVVACLLLTTAAALLLWPHHGSTSVSAPSPVLVVLPLRAIGADSHDNALADGLSEDLTLRLAHVKGLRLISSTSALRAQHDGFDTRQLAERLHVTRAIEGTLYETGDRLRIDLRLIETPSGRILWTQAYDRKLAEVFTLQQNIAQAVASALALRIDLAPAAEMAVDPQVFREYLELRHVFLAQSDADYPQAEAALNALAARAPDFAPAHGLLALNLASGFEDDGRDNDALHEARHALDLDPNDIYAHAALGMVASHNHDWVTVKKEYDAALALSPGDPVMRSIVGMWLARLGYGGPALSEFEAAYQADPLNYWGNYNRATQLDTLGRHDEARHFLDLLPGLESRHQWLTITARWRNAVWRHDYVAARGLVGQMSGQKARQNAYAAVTKALMDPAHWPEAESAIATWETKSGSASRLRLFAPPLNAASLLAGFEPGDQQPNGKILWTVDFTALHRTQEFQSFLQRMRFIDYWRSNGWPPQCQPEGDGARCE